MSDAVLMSFEADFKLAYVFDTPSTADFSVLF